MTQLHLKPFAPWKVGEITASNLSKPPIDLTLIFASDASGSYSLLFTAFLLMLLILYKGAIMMRETSSASIHGLTPEGRIISIVT